MHSIVEMDIILQYFSLRCYHCVTRSLIQPQTILVSHSIKGSGYSSRHLSEIVACSHISHCSVLDHFNNQANTCMGVATSLLVVGCGRLQSWFLQRSPNSGSWMFEYQSTGGIRLLQRRLLQPALSIWCLSTFCRWRFFAVFILYLLKWGSVVSKHKNSMHQICMEFSRYIPANLSGLYVSDHLVWLSESFKELLCVLRCAYMYHAEHLLISVPAEPLCSNDSCFFQIASILWCFRTYGCCFGIHCWSVAYAECLCFWITIDQLLYKVKSPVLILVQIL